MVLNPQWGWGGSGGFFWHKNILKSNCPKMHVGCGLQLLTPAGQASQRPKSTTMTTTSRSQVLFFFFFVPLDNKGREKKRNRKTTRKTTATTKRNKKTKKKPITRDDGQGSTHVLGFRRTCCYGNAGCSSPVQGHTARHARSGGPRSYSGSIASSGCSGGVRGGEPGAGAPQLSTQGPPFTRALPPPPQGLALGPGGCLRCLAS